VKRLTRRTQRTRRKGERRKRTIEYKKLKLVDSPAKSNLAAEEKEHSSRSYPQLVFPRFYSSASSASSASRAGF